jgi:hypothetical protein
MAQDTSHMPKRTPRALAVLLFTILAASATADPNPPNSVLNIGYTLAFWAIPFGHTSYEGQLDATTYSAKIHYETGGIASIFWKSVIDANAKGNFGMHSISAGVYESASQDRDKPLQRVKVTFENNAPTNIFSDPPYDTKKYPLSEAQKTDTIDPISAITSIVTGIQDANGPCGATLHVFDGRRRYDLTFTYIKDEPIALKDNLFKGAAHLCEIHYDAIAGYPQQMIRNKQALPEMFADFVDVPNTAMANGHFVVAAKLWTDLFLGRATVTLDTMEIDGMAMLGTRSQN